MIYYLWNLNFNLMKRIAALLFVLTLQISWVRAQTFEGTIRWTMKMDITDPEMKSKMEEGQKKMNDPKNQAQMKEMQERMNDPKMKAMMEANPQMKAQMEKMMKMQQGGGDMSSMMPSGYTIKIKGGNSLTVMEGGMMDGHEVLHQEDGNKSFSLDRNAKTYSVMQTGMGKEDKASMPQVKITKTSETAKILGYTCTKYLAETTMEGRPSTQIFWTTTDIKDIDFKKMASQRMGQGGQPMYYDKLEGVPLKMEMSTPQGTMVMEVAEIKRGSISADEFKIPSDFKETKMPGMH